MRLRLAATAAAVAACAALQCTAAAGLAAPAQAAPPGPASGVLVSGPFGPLDETMYALDGTKTPLTFNSGVSAFSPDGASVAVVVQDCGSGVADSCTSTIDVRDNRGGVRTVASLDTVVSAVTWSPDGSRLAFIRGTDGPQIGDAEIDLVSSTGGGAVTTLIGSTPTFGVSESGRVSWSPAGNAIAFVGSERDEDGTGFGVHHDQVYTMTPAGGSPVRYNAHRPEEQGPGTIYQDEYRDISWSPDGSRVLAYVAEFIDYPCGDGEVCQSEIRELVGTITAGATEPTEVVRIGTSTDGNYEFRGRLRPLYSANGTKIVYAVSGANDKTVTHLRSGTTDKVVPVPAYDDWQRCPTGTCPVWTTHPAPAITLTYANTPKIRAMGTVSPASSGNVTVLLEKKTSSRWTSVTSLKAPLDASGSYTASFATKPKADLCRLTATYKKVSKSKTFSC